jgi:hypothetical protein
MKEKTGIIIERIFDEQSSKTLQEAVEDTIRIIINRQDEI